MQETRARTTVDDFCARHNLSTEELFRSKGFESFHHAYNSEEEKVNPNFKYRDLYKYLKIRTQPDNIDYSYALDDMSLVVEADSRRANPIPSGLSKEQQAQMSVNSFVHFYPRNGNIKEKYPELYQKLVSMINSQIREMEFLIQSTNSVVVKDSCVWRATYLCYLLTGAAPMNYDIPLGDVPHTTLIGLL